MPNNSLGHDPHYPTDPRQDAPNNPEFGVIRTVDGRSPYSTDHYYDGEHHYDHRNVHQPDAPDEYDDIGQINLGGLALILLIVILAILLIKLF